MQKKTSMAIFALSLLSVFISACQKDSNEASITTQVQQDARCEPSDAPRKLASIPGVSLGSALGPGGDLFVPNGVNGTIARVNPKTGNVSTFASGLPPLVPAVGIGGVSDVVFMGGKAYALVTLVDDPTFPTGFVNGIYRIDGPNSFKIIADIGAFNLAHPPTGFHFFVATGLSYAIEVYHGGFLVSDGHLNRVLHVSLDGHIKIIRKFGDVVPTGLAVHGNDVYLSLAGPVPHLPKDGRVVTFNRKSGVELVASGAPLLVDVEFGRGKTIFALSQGTSSGGPEGSPALPNTGSLVRVNGKGKFEIVADKLNQPTSMEIIGNTAYIITLNGDIWTVGDIGRSRHGNWHLN